MIGTRDLVRRAIVASLALLLAVHLATVGMQPTTCDTTYLWEGYAPAVLPPALAVSHPRYRLVRYADKDPKLRNETARLRASRPLLNVLFVPGHSGSHEQMRSLASESVREGVRRGVPGSLPSAWLEWHGADFAAEPTGLEPFLVEKQADFIAGCILHVLAPPTTSAAQPADQNLPEESQEAANPTPPLIVIGYSMGGTVARAALRRLPAHALRRVVLLLTLGSPHHHLPGLVPPAAPPAPFYTVYTLGATAGVEAEEAEGGGDGRIKIEGGGRWAPTCDEECCESPPPEVHVLAGPGDLSVPEATAWIQDGRLAGVPAPVPCAGGFQISMQDVPGLWDTTGHKGLVSCNQLVRALAPALAEAAAAAAVDGVRGPALAAPFRDATVTDVGAVLRGWSEGEGSNGWETTTARARGAGPLDTTLAAVVLPEGSTCRLTWDFLKGSAGDEDMVPATAAGVLVLATAVDRPLQVFSAPRKGKGAGAASCGRGTRAVAAVPLPPLVPSLRRVWGRRPWREVMAVIDWKVNATWLAFIPFSPGDHAALVLELSATMTNRSAGGQVVVQMVDSPPLKAPPLTLSPPVPWRPSMVLPPGHPAVMRVLGPPVWGGLGGAVLGLLFGPRAPWRLDVRRRSCADAVTFPNGVDFAVGVATRASNTAEFLDPAFIVRDVDDDGITKPNAVRAAGSSLPLWQPRTALPQGRELLLVTDPRCSYLLKVRWDLLRWLATSLQHHAFALPPLALAWALARLSSSNHPATVVYIMAAAVFFSATVSQEWHAGLASLRRYLGPAAAATAAGAIERQGVRPWLPIGAVEGVAIALKAAGMAEVLGIVAAAALATVKGATRRATSEDGHAASAAAGPPTPEPQRSALRYAAGLFPALLSGLAHPSLPMLCGTLQLAWAAPSTPAAAAWLRVHSLALTLPLPSLIAWGLNGFGYRHPLLLVYRIVAALLGLHAATLSSHSATEASGGGLRLEPAWLLGATSRGAAALAAVAALWGHPFVGLYCAAAVVVADWAGRVPSVVRGVLEAIKLHKDKDV